MTDTTSNPAFATQSDVSQMAHMAPLPQGSDTPDSSGITHEHSTGSAGITSTVGDRS